MNTILEFGKSGLVFDSHNIQELPPHSKHKEEGVLTRAWIKYRNGDCQAVSLDASEDTDLYFPVWMSELACPKTEEEVLAERGEDHATEG